MSLQDFTEFQFLQVVLCRYSYFLFK